MEEMTHPSTATKIRHPDHGYDSTLRVVDESLANFGIGAAQPNPFGSHTNWCLSQPILIFISSIRPFRGKIFVSRPTKHCLMPKRQGKSVQLAFPISEAYFISPLPFDLHVGAVEFIIWKRYVRQVYHLLLSINSK